MKIIKNNDFENDDICICEVKMFDRQDKLVFTFKDIHCPLREYKLRKPKNMLQKEFKKVTKIVIRTIEKIGSKAIIN